MTVDIPTLAGFITAFLALTGVAVKFAPYLSTASRKLGALDQLFKDVGSDVSDADQLVVDASAALASIQAGTVSAAQLQSLKDDTSAVVAAFKKTVADGQSVLSA
jgi:hypothetical protein